MKTIKKIIDGQNVKEEKEWFHFELSPYRYLTFLEFQQIIHSIGCGLKSVGLKKDEKIQKSIYMAPQGTLAASTMWIQVLI